MKFALLLTLLPMFDLSVTASGENSDQTGKNESIGSSFIINGKPAAPGQFPWMAHMILKGSSPLHYCGAAIVARNVLLTAAHCVLKRRQYITHPKDQVEVVVGDLDITTLEVKEKHIKVKEILVHGDYNWTTLANDIAILVLEQPVSCGQNLRPILLPFTFDKYNSVSMSQPPEQIPLKSWSKAECYMSGWGDTTPGEGWFHPSGNPSKNLLYIEYPGVISSENCELQWMESGEWRKIRPSVKPGMLCTKSKIPEGSDCHGDSGGPLVCKAADENWILVGLTSWGAGDCAKPYINVFSDVGYYLNWIYEALKQYPDAFKEFWQSFVDCSSFTFKGKVGKQTTTVIRECMDLDKKAWLKSIGLYCSEYIPK